MGGRRTQKMEEEVKIYYKTTKSGDVRIFKFTGMGRPEIRKRFGDNIAQSYFDGANSSVRSDGVLVMTFESPVALGSGIEYVHYNNSCYNNEIAISEQDTEAKVWLLKSGDTITKQSFNKIVKFLHRCSAELRMLIDFEENSPIKIVTIP